MITDEFPGVNVSFTQPFEMRTSEMLSGVRGDLAIKIYGPDLPVLNELAVRMVAIIKTVPGNEDVLTVKNEGMQYLQVELDRQAIGRFGLSVEQVQYDLRALIEGREVGVVIEQGRRLPLLVRGTRDLQMSPALFASLRLPIADGRALPLAQLARLVPKQLGPPSPLAGVHAEAQGSQVARAGGGEVGVRHPLRFRQPARGGGRDKRLGRRRKGQAGHQLQRRQAAEGLARLAHGVGEPRRTGRHRSEVHGSADELADRDATEHRPERRSCAGRRETAHARKALGGAA